MLRVEDSCVGGVDVWVGGVLFAGGIVGYVGELRFEVGFGP